MCIRDRDKIKQGFGEGVPHFSYAIFNDMDSVKALANKETSAIMLELVQGESGVQPADKAFVKALSDYCQETGIYLIVDEVQTGIGRTGKLFAYEHYDIEPDIFTPVSYTHLSQFAREHAVAILGGSVAIERDGKFYNTTYVYNKSGNLINIYSKVHL